MAWRCQCGVVNKYSQDNCRSCKNPATLETFTGRKVGSEWDFRRPISEVYDWDRGVVEVELENGIIVEVERILIAKTFEGHLMVDSQFSSFDVRQETRGWIAKTFSGRDADAAVIVDEGKEVDPLPRYRVLANMRSKSLVDPSKGMCFSFLTACWFVDDAAIPLEELVARLFHKIKWEDHARDGDP